MIVRIYWKRGKTKGVVGRRGLNLVRIIFDYNKNFREKISTKGKKGQEQSTLLFGRCHVLP
jgi:hypothetical protein